MGVIGGLVAQVGVHVRAATLAAHIFVDSGFDILLSFINPVAFFNSAARGKSSDSFMQRAAAIVFELGIVWIKWLGTHKDYDQIEVTEVDHGD